MVIKKLQDIQICSTLDTTSARWDWNCLTTAQIIEANSFGKTLEVTSFFCLKSSIRICLTPKIKIKGIGLCISRTLDLFTYHLGNKGIYWWHELPTFLSFANSV